MTMKLGLGLYGNMLTSENFRFAKQAGASHIVAHIVGNFNKPRDRTTAGDGFKGFGLSDPEERIWSAEGMSELADAVRAEGLQLEAIENFEPAHWYDILLDGPKRAEQIEHVKQIIRNVGAAGIPVFGYNFSIAGVWGRDQGPVARGGALSVGYHDPEQPPIPRGMIWNMVYDEEQFDPTGAKGVIEPFSHDELWRRFAAFLDDVLPTAEEAGVKLALHPDDPPLPTLRGTPRLVYRADLYQKVLDIAPSPANGMEFCIGTLAEMNDGSDIYQVIDQYSRTGRIHYVHFRNVRGKVPVYDEMFVDDGDVDMIEAMRILKRNNYEGVLIPDHTPAMSCAAPWHAGKAYALGWMRATLALI
jgi:mannonate dehydratase